MDISLVVPSICQAQDLLNDVLKNNLIQLMKKKKVSWEYIQ